MKDWFVCYERHRMSSTGKFTKLIPVAHFKYLNEAMNYQMNIQKMYHRNKTEIRIYDQMKEPSYLELVSLVNESRRKN